MGSEMCIRDRGYDRESLTRPEIDYQGPVVSDHYGRQLPKHAHGTVSLEEKTASAREITEAVMELYDRIVDPRLLLRRLNLTAALFTEESAEIWCQSMEQLDLFSNPEEKQRREEARAREKRRLQAMLHIKKKYGKNAIFRGMDLEDGATARERNNQIGGHKA